MRTRCKDELSRTAEREVSDNCDDALDVVDAGGEDGAGEIGGAVTEKVAHALGYSDGTIGCGNYRRTDEWVKLIVDGEGVGVCLVSGGVALFDGSDNGAGCKARYVVAGCGDVANDWRR